MHEQQKKSALLFCTKLVLVLINTAIFAVIWYAFFRNKVFIPFYSKGNYAIVILFALLYGCFARLYGGFDLAISRISALIYSQLVALVMTDLVVYCIIWLLERHLPNILPILILLGAGFAFSVVWAREANRLTNKLLPPKRTILIYDNVKAYQSGRSILEKISWRFHMVDLVNATCPLEDILAEMQEKRVEAVMLCGVHSSRRNDIVKYCIEHNIMVYLRPNIGDMILAGSKTTQIANLPVVICQRSAPSILYIAGKRLMDIVFSLAGLVLASPIMLITAAAVKTADRGPILYKQLRLTKDGKAFCIYKFRSMRMDAEKDGVARMAAQGDNRITPVGRIIRTCRIDELPQLFNILCGSMSIVGPRPERPEIASQYEKTMPEFILRLQVKAGLTGYAQVFGKYNTEPYDKLQMDLLYIAKQSFATDLIIILATIKILFMPESTEGVAEGQVTSAAVKNGKTSKGENECEKC